MSTLFSDDQARIPSYVILDANPLMPLSQTIDWGLKQLKIPDLHNRGITGKGIRIAVLDTGVDIKHSDLKIASAKDFTQSGTPKDTVGHGTHVIGIISAQGNEQGVLGVAPDAEIHSYKVLGENGGNLVDVANAIRYAADHGMNIINMSLGSTSDAEYLKSACNYAANKGVIIVVSAGNSGKEQLFYPASYQSCYATGATNIHKDVSGFSSYSDQLDWAAPGERILSTYLNGGYAVLSGTSMAAPFASGCVALMLQAGVKPQYDILTKSTDDILALGFDLKSGWGIINPHKAINNISQIPIENKDIKSILLEVQKNIERALSLVQ